MQKAFDELYQQSKNGNNFYKLLEIIGSEQNICLAYRNLKTNSGSKTAGTDGKTIEGIKGLSDREVIETVRKQLADYHPQSVRRVFIPKPGSDKKRPLGIPCIWDRLIQQCILQVLEPICEPKFHNHSYGFRQNRDAHHAVSRVVSMVNMYKHYYCVDVDIKGFFDNVNHGKLLKQIWTLGIRDKRLLCIISKILKSEIEGEGIPDKGTPQGGLISPLLSLIVLNELDWWVSSQWETFTPNGVKKGNMKGSKGWLSYARKYTNLKDGYVVDDLIEPFRPIVDLKVVSDNILEPLSTLNKKSLTEVTSVLVSIDGRRHSVQTAIDIYCESLRRAVELKDADQLLLPDIIGLERETDDEKRAKGKA